MATFLFEPFLLHAECADADTAQRILEVAREAGMRESGLSLGRKRVMVQIRTLALRLEVPIGIDGKALIDKEYFDTLLRLANQRLVNDVEIRIIRRRGFISIYHLFPNLYKWI